METEKQDEKQGGFYNRALSLEEVTDLVHLAIVDGLDDEIAAVRAATRRTLVKLEEELSPAEFVKMIATVNKGANTIANLLRTRRAISGQAMDGLSNAIAQAIQELQNERQWIF